MSDTGLRVWWSGMLGHKIETAEACGGVVTLRVDQARELNQIVLQHNALADALEGVRSALGDRLLGQGPLSREYAHGVIDRINEALRLAGRMP